MLLSFRLTPLPLALGLRVPSHSDYLFGLSIKYQDSTIPFKTIRKFLEYGKWRKVEMKPNEFKYHRSTVQAKKNFFCYILSLLAKWNMIFCLYGAFLENSLSKQNFPSPHMLAVCMQGEGESLSFFSKASCTVHGFAAKTLFMARLWCQCQIILKLSRAFLLQLPILLVYLPSRQV